MHSFKGLARGEDTNVQEKIQRVGRTGGKGRGCVNNSIRLRSQSRHQVLKIYVCLRPVDPCLLLPCCSHREPLCQRLDLSKTNEGAVLNFPPTCFLPATSNFGHLRLTPGCALRCTVGCEGNHSAGQSGGHALKKALNICIYIEKGRIKT